MSKKKVGGKWDDISDEQLKDMIQESYENGMKMLDSLSSHLDTRISDYAKECNTILNLYFTLHNNAYTRQPKRDILEHSLEILHLFSSKKQAISHLSNSIQILIDGMGKDIFFDKLSKEDQEKVLPLIMDKTQGGKRRRKRKKRKRKKTRKKRKRKSRKRKSKKRKK